jgi:predicted acylesterase/phospholipase RssA
MLTVWDPWTIWNYVRTTGFRKIAETLFDQNILRITEGMAINSGAALENLLQQGMQDLANDRNATFEDLYRKTGKKLVITVTNVRTGFAEYWSVDNVPRMEVWRALRASVSLPILFPAFKIANAKYTDGGLACNIPCQLFPADRTLTLFVHAPTVDQGGITSNYFRQLMHHYSDAAQLGQFRVQPLYACRSVPCMAAPTNVSAYALNATNEEIDALVLQGARCWAAVCARNVLIGCSIYFLKTLNKEEIVEDPATLASSEAEAAAAALLNP